MLEAEWMVTAKESCAVGVVGCVPWLPDRRCLVIAHELDRETLGEFGALLAARRWRIDGAHDPDRDGLGEESRETGCDAPRPLPFASAASASVKSDPLGTLSDGVVSSSGVVLPPGWLLVSSQRGHGSALGTSGVTGAARDAPHPMSLAPA